MAMTSLHQQQQRRLLFLFPSTKRLFLLPLPPLSFLGRLVVGVVVFVGVVVVVVVVMFKSLHLVEIRTLMSAF